MSPDSPIREAVVLAYGRGNDTRDIARLYDISPNTVRGWASKAGVARFSIMPEDGSSGITPPRQAMSGADTADDNLGAPAPSTRRCRNKDCIERFVPVNDQHWYCSPPCRSSTNLWEVADILREEAAVSPDTSPMEMAKRFAGQKNRAVRRVTQLTSMREFMRFEIGELARSAPESLLKPKPPAPPAKKGGSPREIILICSDWQIGKLQNGIGVDAMQNQRLPKILDATTAVIKHFNNSGHPVTKLHIVFAGDIIEGCYIYGGQNVTGLDKASQTHMLIGQISKAATMQADLAMNLAAHVPEVVAHSVPGNHGRPNGKNDFADPEDNFDTLCAMWAKDKSSLQKNLTWDISQEWFNWFVSEGHIVASIHGDQWRGPVEQLQRLLPQWVLADVFRIGQAPQVFITGHRHDFTMFRVNGITVVQNGTIDGGSDWYLKSYGKASPPTQVILVMSEKHGVEATYPICF